GTPAGQKRESLLSCRRASQSTAKGAAGAKPAGIQSQAPPAAAARVEGTARQTRRRSAWRAIRPKAKAEGTAGQPAACTDPSRSFGRVSSSWMYTSAATEPGEGWAPTQATVQPSS